MRGRNELMKTIVVMGIAFALLAINNTLQGRLPPLTTFVVNGLVIPAVCVLPMAPTFSKDSRGLEPR